MIWRRSFWWQLLLLAGSLLLLVGIFQVWFGSNRNLAASRARKSPAVPKVKPLRDLRPLKDFAVVSSKDLFSQGRQGPDPTTQTVKAQASLEGYTLMGTIMLGAEKAALISNKAGRGRKSSQVEVVRLGEEWEGFKVVEISNDAVVFQGKDGRKTLNFPE